MMLKVKVLREIPVQVKPVQGKGYADKERLSDHSGSLIPMKREVEEMQWC